MLWPQEVAQETSKKNLKILSLQEAKDLIANGLLVKPGVKLCYKSLASTNPEFSTLSSEETDGGDASCAYYSQPDGEGLLN